MPRSHFYSIEGRLPRWLQSELRARIASGVVLILVALAASAAGGVVFSALWLLAGILAAIEWIEMTRTEPRPRLRRVAGVTLIACAGLWFLGAGAIGVAAAAAIGLGAALAFAWAGRDRLWAAAGLACALVLVLAPPIVRADPRLGLFGVLWMFAVVWGTDIAAYAAGRTLGGPKLWPAVSPKKTWSGFVGGLLAGTAGGLLVAEAALRSGEALPLSLAAIGLVSGIASVASQGGDLAESALKRHFKVKDSSQLIPGHGGVLDRLDGFWAVAALVGLLLLVAELRPPGAP